MAREASKEELLSAQARLWSYTYGCIRPMSLMVAVQLGIPDAVHSHDGPISPSILASAVGIPKSKVPALRRLMRALAHFGVFHVHTISADGRTEAKQEVYSSTIFSQQLLKDSPTTAVPFLLHGMYPLLVTPWYSMAGWFRGEGPETSSGFEAAHGETVWESLGRVPEFNNVINGAMSCDTRWLVGLVAREHPEVFRGVPSLVDVGGGNGVAAKAIKEAFPEMRCTVLELPHVVAASPAIEGVEFVEGDMFEHVPPADAILLKRTNRFFVHGRRSTPHVGTPQWVLHDWYDEDCVRILERCREAILSSAEQKGKVIIMEMVVGGDDGGDRGVFTEAQHLMDLQMLVIAGGRERDEGEWRRILAAANFSRCKFSPVLGPRSIIEAFP